MKELYSEGLELQSYTQTSDGLGGYTQEWATVLKFDAVLDLLSQQRQTVANKAIEASTHIIMRADDYDEIIAALDNKPLSRRIKFEGKYYKVKFYDTPFDDHLEIFIQFDGDTYEV